MGAVAVENRKEAENPADWSIVSGWIVFAFRSATAVRGKFEERTLSARLNPTHRLRPRGEPGSSESLAKPRHLARDRGSGKTITRSSEDHIQLLHMMLSWGVDFILPPGLEGKGT
jgi:hypothetical protein